MSTAVCSGNHKTRLIIGDGNFSYTLALINKHDQKAHHDPEHSLGHAIITTELKESIRCGKCDELSLFDEIDSGDAEKEETSTPTSCDSCLATMERIEVLKAKGVTVEFSVDGTKIHEKFPGRTFARIHWNGPHDGSNYKEQTLPPIIEAFFKSCVKVQQVKGRIHIALAQPNDHKNFYQAFVYNIARAATVAGYTLVKKRKFGPDRYPGYQHMQTHKNISAAGAERMREFVFEKIETKSFQALVQSVKVDGKYPIHPLAKKIAATSAKKYQVKVGEFYREGRSYIECASDEDSSDCEELK